MLDISYEKLDRKSSEAFLTKLEKLKKELMVPILDGEINAKLTSIPSQHSDLFKLFEKKHNMKAGKAVEEKKEYLKKFETAFVEFQSDLVQFEKLLNRLYEMADGRAAEELASLKDDEAARFCVYAHVLSDTKGTLLKFKPGDPEKKRMMWIQTLRKRRSHNMMKLKGE